MNMHENREKRLSLTIVEEFFFETYKRTSSEQHKKFVGDRSYQSFVPSRDILTPGRKCPSGKADTLKNRDEQTVPYIHGKNFHEILCFHSSVDDNDDVEFGPRGRDFHGASLFLMQMVPDESFAFKISKRISHDYRRHLYFLPIEAN